MLEQDCPKELERASVETWNRIDELMPDGCHKTCST